MRQQVGSAVIVLVLVLAVLAGVVVYLTQTNKVNLAGPISHEGAGSMLRPSAHTANLSGQVPLVNTPQDLTTVSNDLDNTNIDSMNQGLSQNDADASNF